MQTTVGMSRELYDGSVFNQVIERVAKQTGVGCEVVKRMPTAYCATLLQECGGELVMFDSLDAVFVPEGYPGIRFIVEDESERPAHGTR